MPEVDEQEPEGEDVFRDTASYLGELEEAAKKLEEEEDAKKREEEDVIRLRNRTMLRKQHSMLLVVQA